MRLIRLSLRGVTTYRAQQDIDFDALGDGLVAITGPNGAGKSSLMECVPAALHKTFATRAGSLYDYCHGRDAYISATFDAGGDIIEVRLLIDAEQRKTDGYVNVNGQPVTDGKAASFEAAIARLFGSRELFLASVFAAQSKRGSVLEMRKSERKSLFLELLALGAIEAAAATANVRRGEADAAVSAARLIVQTAQAQIAGLDEDVEDLATLRYGASETESAVQDARRAVDRGIAELAEAKARAETSEQLRQAHERARAATQAARARVAEGLQAQQLAEQDAEQRLRYLVDTSEDLALRARLDHDREMEAISQGIQRAQAVIDSAPDFEALQQDRDTALQQQLIAEANATEYAKLDAEVRRAEMALDLARKLQQQQRDSRLTLLRAARERASLIGRVPCHPLPELSSTCPLLQDAREAAQRIATLEDTAGEEALEREICAEADRIVALRAKLKVSAAPGGEPAWSAQIRALDEQLSRRYAVEAARAAMAGFDEQRARAVARLDAAVEDAAQHGREVAHARARVEEQIAHARALYGEQIARAQVDLAAATDAEAQALAAIRDVDAIDLPPLARAVDLARIALDCAEQQAQRQRDEMQRLQERVDTGRALQVRIQTELAPQVERAETDLTDWDLLARALGRDGIQALEVDAAGPEVARIANELLESCYGPRFSIAFETLREKQGGGYSEVFDVVVYDGAAERRAEDLSGGERVIVGEAISLALAIFNARKSGIRWRTLWRDETAGALDPENADRYVAMLRRAREAGGFSQVIYVAHLPAVTEAADVRLVIADGRVKTEAA